MAIDIFARFAYHRDEGSSTRGALVVRKATISLLAAAVLLFALASSAARAQFGISADGVYLGRLSVNRWHPESTANPFGRYGNSFSPLSLASPYSRYGSRWSPYSWRSPYAYRAPRLYAADGTYLGKLSANRFDPESVFNPYSRYGNPHSPVSIWNRYGRYGSKHSPYSWRNPYGSYAPLIYGAR